MNEKSAFLTGRNALIGAVIALAFNPLYLVIGYYLSKSLGSPRIRIEFVKPVLGYKDVAVGQDVVTDIMVNKDAFDKVKAQWLLASTKTDAGLIQNLFQWSQLFKTSAVPYDFLEVAVRQEPDVLLEYDAKIKIMKENLDALSHQVVLDISVLRAVSGFDLQRVEEARKNGDPNAPRLVIERWMAGLEQEKDALAKIFARFRELIQAGRERDGDVSFEVGLLNLGDTEGVVYPDGELSIDGRTLRMTEQVGRYVVVGPHSFSRCVFKIKKEEATGKDLDYLRSIVIKCMPQRYRLTIKMPNGTRSIQEVLPVTNAPPEGGSFPAFWRN